MKVAISSEIGELETTTRWMIALRQRQARVADAGIDLLDARRDHNCGQRVEDAAEHRVPREGGRDELAQVPGGRRARDVLLALADVVRREVEAGERAPARELEGIRQVEKPRRDRGRFDVAGTPDALVPQDDVVLSRFQGQRLRLYLHSRRHIFAPETKVYCSTALCGPRAAARMHACVECDDETAHTSLTVLRCATDC